MQRGKDVRDVLLPGEQQLIGERRLPACAHEVGGGTGALRRQPGGGQHLSAQQADAAKPQDGGPQRGVGQSGHGRQRERWPNLFMTDYHLLPGSIENAPFPFSYLDTESKFMVIFITKLTEGFTTLQVNV